MNLLRSILSEPWSIDENYALQMMPFLSSILNGEKINTDGIISKRTTQFAFLAGETVSMQNESDYTGSEQEGVVAILPIYDVLLKYDTMCGPMGMKTMDAILQRWDEDPSIVGIVLDIDSPGGQASYLPNLSATIRNLKTPIISFYSGTCASAAYYIASQTDEIYSSAETDIVGSIGTMLQFISPNKEKVDFVLHSIYATKSTDKNRPFEEAMNGKYDLIRTSLLDPFNDSFHEAVLSARENVDKAAFSGATYTTTKAIDMKLIDGRMASIKEAIARAFALGKEAKQSSNNQNTNSEMKKFERISAILGKEVTAETVLTGAELEMIENHSENPVASTQPAPTAEEIAASMSGSITEAVASALAPVQESLTALEARIVAMEEGAGANASVTTPTAGAEGGNHEPWNDPNRSYNKLAE